MNKKYIVRLSDEERGVCQEIVKRLKGTSEKVKRAQILLRRMRMARGGPMPRSRRRRLLGPDSGECA